MQAESSVAVGVVRSTEVSQQYDVTSPNFDQTTQKITKKLRRSLPKIYLFVYKLSATSL